MAYRSRWNPSALSGIRRCGIALLSALLLGLAMAPAAQGATITKVADKTHVYPLEKITYTITVHATKPARVTVTDTLPFGVVYAGNLSPPEATYSYGGVTWSGDMMTGDTVVIRFDVVVGDWETVGPLPIINTACANDGTEICSSVAVFLSWYRLYVPISVRNVSWDDPGLPWSGR